MCVCVGGVCVWVGGRSVRLCECVCVCRFSAWKDGWRSTSAEELLLVTVRGERQTERADGEALTV